jgi:hypothetical protein
VQGRVLPWRRDAHGILKGHSLAPFLGRPGTIVGADLVDPPIEFEMMAVGIEELDRDLAAGAAAAFSGSLQQLCGAAGGYLVGLVPHEGAVNLGWMMLAFALTGAAAQFFLRRR